MADKKTILIVDDEVDILTVLSARLIDAGYDVLKADNGIEAIDIAKQKMPHLIILDIMMPHMDGVTVSQHLKENKNTKDIPVIFLTALQGKKEEMTNHKSGKNIIFSKPYNPKELLDKIKELIG
ncbi:MAG: response regulator [Candidatus Omnitrophica bacterium]|nr:response regulator [Candidatus Omnitrophota bacterium]MDD5352133.1 response regulator [Candidatus Omnitrophota bacterium]MDD5549731.1 response regulator [Candidatus Omnitrophota bacterium]